MKMTNRQQSSIACSPPCVCVLVRVAELVRACGICGVCSWVEKFASHFILITLTSAAKLTTRMAKYIYLMYHVAYKQKAKNKQLKLIENTHTHSLTLRGAKAKPYVEQIALFFKRKFHFFGCQCTVGLFFVVIRKWFPKTTALKQQQQQQQN